MPFPRRKAPVKLKQPVSPAARLLGIKELVTGRGKSLFEMPVRKEHRNHIGSVHGGVLATLADAASGAAFRSILPGGSSGATVEFKISFLKPVFYPDCLRARAGLISSGKRLGFLECEIINKAGKRVAKSASTCMILQLSAEDRSQEAAPAGRP